MSIKHTLTLYTDAGIVVKFDDAIPDVIVRDVDPFGEETAMSVLQKINRGEYEGGEYHMHPTTYISEIIDDNAWFQFRDAEPNPDLVEIINCIGHDRKINCIKAIRYLTGCGLKEAKDFVEEIIDGPKPSELQEAADELKEEFRSTREPTLGDILASALER